MENLYFPPSPEHPTIHTYRPIPWGPAINDGRDFKYPGFLEEYKNAQSKTSSKDRVP